MDFVNAIIAQIKSFLSNLFTSTSMPVDRDTVRVAIIANIVSPLKLPDVCADILLAQSILETGNFESNAFMNTNSLFNRHKGSGRGFWTGQTFYANPGDPDLRVYESIAQSAQDMAQLLTDPYYATALLNLRLADSIGYYNELQSRGFSTDLTYASALKRTYAEIA